MLPDNPGSEAAASQEPLDQGDVIRRRSGAPGPAAGERVSAGSAAALERVSSRDIKRSTIIGWVAGVVAVADFTLFGTLLPRITKAFGWSQSYALLVSTLVSVGAAVALFVIGPIVDRIGRRRGMMLTVAGTAVGSAATAAVTGAGAMIGVRAISGLSMSEQSVNATYLNELYAVAEDQRVNRHRGLVFSAVQTAWPFGALAAALFALLVTAIFGPDEWRYTFLIATGPAIIIAILCRILRDSPQFVNSKARKATQRKRRAVTWSGSEPTLVTIFRRPQLRNTVVLAVCWLANWMAIQTFSVLGTTALESGKGISVTNSLVIVVVSNLVGAAGYVIHGWVGDHLPRHMVIAVGWVLGAGMFTLMMLGPSSTAFVIVTYMFGLFFLLGPYSALLSFQSECYPTECRATGGAFAFAMSQPGAIIGGFLLSAITGIGWAYGMAALVVGGGACLLSGIVMFGARAVSRDSIGDV